MPSEAHPITIHHYFVRRMNVAYTASLNPPAIMLARNIAEASDLFYKKLSPHFQLNLSSMRALQSNTISETGLQFSLFFGGADIIIKPDSLEIRCNNLSTDQDIEVTRNASLVVADTMKILYPSTSINTRSFTVSSWLSIDASDATIDFIVSLTDQAPAHQIATLLFPNQDMHYVGHTIEFGDLQLNRMTRIVFQRSALDGANLFFLYQENFSGETATQPLSNQLRDLHSNFLLALSAIGLIPNQVREG